MYSDKISQAQDLIELRPELMEERPIYESILQFYSDTALIETQIADLKALLSHKKIELYKVKAKSFKECIYNLLDEHPEVTASKGMLRFYEVANLDWVECEKAEIIFGDALTLDVYDWKPDAWTVFEKESGEIELTVVAAAW
ncbi:MAG: hypothetical protein LBC85_11420 [Fibromonadaceae bacterium]|jgi:hypothetical protein|nr:hypothetical protein [Fibromonadaceae bacterium]